MRADGWRRRAARATIGLVALLAVGGLGACTGGHGGDGGDGSDGAADTSGARAAAAPGGAPAMRTIRVGIVFDIGGRGDRGFNDGAAAGAEMAKARGGVTVAYADAMSDAERDAALERFAKEGMELVIGVGFLSSAPITRLAQRYPAVRFAVIDYSIPMGEDGRAILPPANLAAVNFREEEGSYLVGAVAGLTTRTRTVGFVGGMENPMIRRFAAGYETGVRRVCATCRVVVQYAGTTPAAFRDRARGRQLAAGQYAAGADVIFQAAGGTGLGVFDAARAANQRVIGVDVDQAGLAPGLVLTSMLKRVDVAVADVIGRTRRGTFRGGLVSYGLSEGALGYVHDARNVALLPADVRQRVDVLREAIAAGLLPVPTTR